MSGSGADGEVAVTTTRSTVPTRGATIVLEIFPERFAPAPTFAVIEPVLAESVPPSRMLEEVGFRQPESERPRARAGRRRMDSWRVLIPSSFNR
jgi:hypothetical protein